jgi:hypothetical protein
VNWDRGDLAEAALRHFWWSKVMIRKFHLLVSSLEDVSPVRAGHLLSGVGGLALIFLGVTLPTGPATAQLDKMLPNALQKILPGGGQDQGDAIPAAKKACERYAQDRGFDVRRVREAQPSGKNNIEVTLDLDQRNGREDYICTYDTGDRQVRTLERTRGTQARDSNQGVAQSLARRARQACEEIAQRRDYAYVEVTDVSSRNDKGMVQVEMRARGGGSNRDVTCLYDDANDKAFLTD